MSGLAVLLSKVEAASGRDREIDVALHEMAGLAFVMEYWSEASTEQTRNLSYVPQYTSSIDAAVALIERRLPEWAWAVSKIEGVPTRAPSPAWSEWSRMAVERPR